MTRHRTRQPGFTLLEVVLAASILSLTVAVLTQAVLAGQMQTYAALRKERAVSVGQSMIEEVLSRPYADPDGDTAAGPDSGEAGRADFDAIDDYDGFTQAPGSLTTAPTETAAGERYPDAYQNFGVSVSAPYANDDQKMSLPGLGDSRDGIMLTVTITDTRGPTLTLNRFVPRPADAGGGS